ncbi:hypothetical protein [Bradyrhizobium sp. 170]|uniref:hypothetical protein n=1 Tax=Bradyrhizobium sp. 170 TaxID=2782641 RepID=UPI001FFFBBE4|nr:hypothetical protein [Bradyrhizobium sp. 170]UPK07666.1 hypothetical protein IVB05_20425 [Bradyrhizobium sp. 170]
MDLDAEHRPLVGLVQFLRARPPSGLPDGTSESEWRLTRGRHSDDVNAEVREAVDRDGYSLFRIGLSLSEIPKS